MILFTSIVKQSVGVGTSGVASRQNYVIGETPQLFQFLKDQFIYQIIHLKQVKS
ncbi:MAG: hypothetical protein CM15mP113_2010 [Pseudomonadota bacterium]|nr:MAG: hypothetical protein CM15mP113_2010 [Pseudomonadota bacterium]